MKRSSSSRALVRLARTLRRRLHKPWFEPLEERVMLDASTQLPPAIVVGRTLSSYFVGGVQNNQETITYTVYNEQADPETGALLTTSLEPGVNFKSASQPADQSGSNLAWSLGTIPGFGRASVEMTVQLANPIPTQLDSGAHAFATLDGGAVSNSTPAASLRSGNLADASLLASTPDANTTDPFVQEEAAKLAYDPQQIFAFLHNEIGYNSYLGSVRGARGTLWSSAGNALDVASLGVALMRASGIPAQYVQGTLSKAQAQQLILSMFPASFQTTGYVPSGTPTADPADDPQLLSETESHFWFQFDTGGGMKDADPLMPGATVGQAFTSSSGKFTEVPDALREKTRIQLTAETYSEFDALLGTSGLSTQVVLDQSFNDVDLVGRPLSIGHTVSTQAQGLGVTQIVYTYSPYVALGDEAFPDPSTDQTINGTSYQEVYSNADGGLVSRELTGFFLNVTLSGPQGAPEGFQHTILDRIGFAARQNPNSLDLTIPDTSPPAFTLFDLTTVNVLPGLQYRAAIGPQADQVANVSAHINELGAATATGQAGILFNLQALGMTRALAEQFLIESDTLTAELAHVSRVGAFFARPRLIVTSQRLIPGAAGKSSTLATKMNLLADAIRVVPIPGQAADVSSNFNLSRGFSESQIESRVVAGANPNSTVVSAAQVFAAADQKGIPVAVLQGNDAIARLGSLGLDPDSTARMAVALQAGQVVIVPTAPVTIDGQSTTAWYQVDPSTGQTTDGMADGSHNALIIVLVSIAIVLTIMAIEVKPFIPNQITAAPGTVDHLRQLASNLTKLDNAPKALIADIKTDKKDIQDQIDKLQKKLKGLFTDLDVKQLKQLQDDFDGAKNTFPLLNLLEPPVRPQLLGALIPPPLPGNVVQNSLALSGNVTAGATGGSSAAANTAASGRLAANWDSSAASAFRLVSLSSASAAITDAAGKPVGSGAVGLSATTPVAAAVVGHNHYDLAGTGSLTFYGPAESTLGVGGDWASYTATVTGNVAITLTTDGLAVNGQMLPAGTYTITTNSATLTGSGPSTSPNFAGSASLNVTGGTVTLGPENGTITLGGQPLDLSSGATFDGYTGSLTVTAKGNGTDSVAFNGNSDNVLTVSATPATRTTDQNTPVTFQANVNTSFPDTYNITAQAPPGWTVSIDNTGKVTVSPAPGRQSGTFPIEVIAQSQKNPNLVAQTTVNVTVTSTQPGERLTVITDPLLTVPFNGADLPTAFQVQIHNSGPAPVTEDLAFTNIPSGFTMLDSGMSVTIPAGQTGIVGVYLVPNGTQLPAAGSMASFTVTASNAGNEADTHTVDEPFTIPALHSVTIAADPLEAVSTPGVATAIKLTLTNAGNVAETVELASTGASGLALGGLATATIPAGQTKTETITLTPAANAAINSVLAATVTGTFGSPGSPQTATAQVNAQVRSAEVEGVAQASVKADQAGNPQLAATLSDLADAIAQLQASPTDTAALDRVKFLLTNVGTLLNADPTLAPLQSNLQAVEAQASAGNITAFFAAIKTFSTTLLGTLAIEASQRFTVTATPAQVDLKSGQGFTFPITLANPGTDPVTLSLAASNAPAGVNVQLSSSPVTLSPGQSTTVPLTLTQSLSGQQVFTIVVTASASVVKHTTTIGVAVRPAVADVLSVTAAPKTVSLGAPVSVSALVFDTANASRQALAKLDILDASGTLLRTLPSVPVMLTPGAGDFQVSLGTVDTTGLPAGVYSVRVSLLEPDGTPLPGRAAQDAFGVGQAVTASIAASPAILPPGTSNVTTTISVVNTTGISAQNTTGLPGNPPSAPVAGPVPPSISQAPPQTTPGSPNPPPKAPDDQVEWISNQSGNWDDPANWLDTTTNTHVVPGGNDAVTINVPGVTVTVEAGSQAALRLNVSAGSTLALNGGTLSLGSATEVDGGLILSTQSFSALVMGGDLNLTGTSSWTAGAIDLDGHTLTNTGTLTVSNTVFLDPRGPDNASSRGTMVNRGTIVQQDGSTLQLFRGSTLDNQAGGRYLFAGDNSIVVNGNGADGPPLFSNEGKIEKTAGAGTSSIQVNFNNNAATLQADSGTLSLQTQGGTLDGAILNVAAGALIDLTGGLRGTLISGTFTGSGAGTVHEGPHSGVLQVAPAGATFNFPAGLFQWDGGTIDLNGHTLTNLGTITVDMSSGFGTIFMDSSDNNNSAQGTCVNRGTMIVRDSATLGMTRGAIFDNQAGGTFLFAGDNNALADVGNGIVTQPLLSPVLMNEGTLTKSNGSGTSAVQVDFTSNAGTVDEKTGTLNLPAVGANSGLIEAESGNVTLTLPDPLSSFTGTVEANAGTVTLLDSHPAQPFPSVITCGTWIARQGGTLTWPNPNSITNNVGGTVVIDGAGSSFSALGSLMANFGRLTVTNGAKLTTAGDFFNQGALTIGPGSTLTVPGKFAQDSEGSLDIQVAGTPASGLFGTLAVGRFATLGGLLRAELVDGFSPTAGDQFNAITFAQSAGAFFPVALPVTAAATLRADLSSTALALTAQPATATGTSIHLVSSAPQAPWGQLVTLTASVSAATGTPTGSVVFEVDGSSYQRAPLVNGTANVLTGFTIGQHTVVAYYVSDSQQFATSDTSAQPLTEVVTPGGTPSITVEVGYADNAHGPTFFPNPWFESPGTKFVGDLGGGFDSGAILITNNNSAPVTIDNMTVTIPSPSGPVPFDMWGSNTIPAGGNLILANTNPAADFDTSDLGDLTNPPGFPDGETAHAPIVNLTLNGASLSPFLDTGHVLNTGGFDVGVVLGTTESQNWRPIGTSGFGNPGGSAVGVVVTDNLPASGYGVDPTSITPPPTSASASQVVWNASVLSSVNPSLFQLTGSVADLAPGEVRTVSAGGTVAVTTTTNTGQQLVSTIDLSPVAVASRHLIGIDPATATIAQGAAANYTVSLSNPFTTPETYTLSLAGVDGFTTTLAGSVDVAAGKTVNVPLTITVPAGTAPGDWRFTVSARSLEGGTDSVEGTLTVSPDVALATEAVSVKLSPALATAGPGTPTTYRVIVTNTGDATTTYELTASLPAGLTGRFDTQTVTVAPGLGNAHVVLLTVTPAAATGPGDLPFSVSATSADNASVKAEAPGTVHVVRNGVHVVLSPSTGSPGQTLQLTVTNTGTVADTFQLTVAGPAALAAALAANEVTLGPGQSQVVPVHTSAVTFAVPGGLELGALAISKGNLNIRAETTASLAVPTFEGLATALAPSLQVLPIPGTTSFLLVVNNTGNRLDSFTANIAGTSGPVTASLVGLDLQPTGTIPTFFLPALSQGAVVVNANLQAVGSGTVSIRVQSLTNPSLSQTVQAEVTAGTVQSQTVVFATPSTAPLGQPVTLTARVEPVQGAGQPSGSVTFFIDGKPQAPVRLSPAGAFAIATLSVSTLGVGPHLVAAAYSGDSRFTPSLSNTVFEVTTPLALDGPTVQKLQRFGFHAQPTSLVLTFDEPLDPSNAQNLANYRVVPVNGRGLPAGAPIPILSAVYDPTANTVTLLPAQGLNVHRRYRLTVNGTVPGGLTNTAGLLLDGRHTGQPGSNYVAFIDRKTLAGPNAVGLLRKAERKASHPAPTLAHGLTGSHSGQTTSAVHPTRTGPARSWTFGRHSPR